MGRGAVDEFTHDYVLRYRLTLRKSGGIIIRCVYLKLLKANEFNSITFNYRKSRELKEQREDGGRPFDTLQNAKGILAS